jgi:hypothetical protein
MWVPAARAAATARAAPTHPRAETAWAGAETRRDPALRPREARRDPTALQLEASRDPSDPRPVDQRPQDRSGSAEQSQPAAWPAEGRRATGLGARPRLAEPWARVACRAVPAGRATPAARARSPPRAAEDRTLQAAPPRVPQPIRRVAAAASPERARRPAVARSCWRSLSCSPAGNARAGQCSRRRCHVVDAAAWPAGARSTARFRGFRVKLRTRHPRARSAQPCAPERPPA